jgi:hypothetical protein
LMSFSVGMCVSICAAIPSNVGAAQVKSKAFRK